MADLKLSDRFRALMTGRLPKVSEGSPERKALGASTGLLENVPRYPAPKFYALAREGYGKNSIVYAAIMEIATSAPEAPLRVYRREASGAEEVPTHPLRRLIARPNPYVTEFELWELTLVHLYLAGNAFWEIVPSRAGLPVELYTLRPDRVRVYGTKQKLVDHYTYEVEGIEYPLNPRYVIHFRFPDPLDPVLGMPPLLAALREAATDNEATDYVKVLLQNRAIPGVVIGTEKAIDDATANRLKAKWKQTFGGKNRGEPAFLQTGMKVHELGQSLRDLEFPSLRTISETRLCAALGVPPILVGVNSGLQRSTYRNYEEARRSFWQETIMPLHRRLRDRINVTLLPLFGDTISLEARFDVSDVTALQESVDAKWERANRAVTSGWIMVNEARAEVGLDPDPNGNVYLRPDNVSVVPAGTEGE